MSLLADALQPFIARGLFSVQGRAETSLDELIGRRGFYPSFDTNTGTWELDFSDAEPVTHVLASECSRLGSASFQTYLHVAESLAHLDHLPWALVKAYYAAFYAAHSILRVLGFGCTYIDGRRASTLRQIIQIYGLSWPFERGLYAASLLRSGSVMCFRSINANGGTHEALWSTFNARLKDLETGILAGPLPATDAQSIFIYLTNLRQIMSNGAPGGSWLSSVRNSVQYRQEGGVWYPCQVSRRDQTALARIAGQWLSDPLAIQLNAKACGDIGVFLAGCTFLVGFCRALLARIGERSGRRKSFVYWGPLAYIERNA
jgi:hypothetical protein